MGGWKVVKTDIDRPSGTEINQFLVTTADISGTGYSSQWIANTDWEFRIRALNRRAPAEATMEEVDEDDDGNEYGGRLLEESWSSTIEATPGSDSALRRPDDLNIERSKTDHEGRTGLTLKWDKATTVADSDGDTVNAAAYRIEYSDTGLEEEGYDWKVLMDMEVPDDDTDANRQEFTDNAEGELSASDTLAAGQKRHYRVFRPHRSRSGKRNQRNELAVPAGIRADRGSVEARSAAEVAGDRARAHPHRPGVDGTRRRQ